jgi:hypothetical protein
MVVTPFRYNKQQQTVGNSSKLSPRTSDKTVLPIYNRMTTRNRITHVFERTLSRKGHRYGTNETASTLRRPLNQRSQSSHVIQAYR